MVYMAGYAVRVPIFVNSDLTMVTCTYTMLFFELCMRLGQIPVNSHYRDFFMQAGHNLHITDARGAGVWGTLKNSAVPIYIDGNTLLHKNEIIGGYAVWQEDLAAINTLRDELEATNRNLEAANLALSNIVQAKEQAVRANARAELYAALERDTARHERRLGESLRNLPADESERAARTGIAALLVCYIKRRCQLLVSEMNKAGPIESGEMHVYLDELAEYAGLAGVECLIMYEAKHSLEIRCAVLYYDFMCDLLEWSAVNSPGKIILRIISAGGRDMMKLLMSPDGLNYDPHDRIALDAAAAGGLIEKENLDGMAGVILSLPGVS
jgi:hypothetical protein